MIHSIDYYLPHLKIYTSFLFEASQEVSSIYHSLNSTKLKFDSCLNHLTKPVIAGEKLYPLLNHPDSSQWIIKGIIHKIFHFLFGEPHDATTMNRIKQNIHLLKEN